MQEEVTPEVSRYLQLLQKELDGEKIRRMNYENDAGKLSGFSSIENRDLASYQLDLKEELDRIFHLLSGHILITNEDGSDIWAEPDDDRLKILSDHGVKQIMNIISFYINKNTLLSAYDEDTILWKMKDFGIEFCDLLGGKYEEFLEYPTPEELFRDHKKYIDSGQIQLTEDELYSKCVQWSKEELQSKLRHLPMIILTVTDSIHSTYQRALGGKERDSFRKHVHVSQNVNPMENYQQPKKMNAFNPKTW